MEDLTGVIQGVSDVKINLELKPENFFGSIYSAITNSKGIFVIELDSLRNMKYSTTYTIEENIDFIGLKTTGSDISTIDS